MAITSQIILDFRAAYPAFSDPVEWPDSVLEQALCGADAETGGCGWSSYSNVCGNFKQRGLFLYAAHWLAVTYPSGASDPSNQAGGSKWAVAGKSVGDESITYNNGNLSSMSPGDAWLSSTSFGQQFMRLRRRAGRGARAL